MSDELEDVVARAGCRTWWINAQLRKEWRKLIEDVKTKPKI
jgi:hypothetical protein